MTKVTAAQIAAGREANAAFKAAQASWNQQAASNIVSSAAQSLGVNQSSSWFQTAASRVQAIKPKADQLPIQQQPIQQQPWQQQLQKPTQQQNYNLSNLSNNFGDVWINQTRDVYKWEWLKLSTWNIITDKSAIWDMTNLNDYLKFGKEAELIESKNKWFIAARNDAIIMDIFKNAPKVTQENVDKLIIDYIKAKDPSWTFATWTEWKAAEQNTLASIKSRMWTLPSERDDLTKKATDAFDREIADIKSQYDAEKSAFYKAWAIEDRYTNFNEVNNKIQSTLEAAGKHRAENLYTGMPTDQQISEIAQWLWQDFNTTKKILEWRGFEDLQMQDEFKEKSERPFQRDFEDFELNRSRNIADVETKHQRTQTALNEQIDDVKTQMERTIRVWEKAWALSGWIKSSGYMQWLENIRSDAIKNMDRLSLRKDWDTEDTAMNKWRIIEDFNTNMTRTKQDLETTMNEIKTQNWVALSQYLNQYAPSSSELTRKLNELEDKFSAKSQDAISKYMANLRGITDTMTYDTEKALQLEWMKQQLQQTNVKNMLANNGAALAWINYWDLSTMLKSWDISPTDYTAMAWYMKTLWISSLQSMWVPTPQDFALYDQMLEQWMTPQQAIASITSSNPSRYSLSWWSGWSDWKYDENSWQYMRTNAAWQLKFSSIPWQQTNQQVPTNYTPADNNQMMEWWVILSKYKDWDKAPRDWYCWQFVNDYLKWMWITNENLFIDPITDKARYVNSDVPTKGSIMIMDSKTSPQHWHVAVVESVNADWTLNLKEANWNWDWKIHVRKNVDPNKLWVKVHWYFDPTKLATAQQTTQQSQQLERNNNNFEAYLRSFSEKGNWTLAFGWSSAEREAALKEMWYWSWAAFNKDYTTWLQNKAQEPVDPWFITALKDVTENPLFDYTDSNWVKHKGLLGKQWILDARTISQIEDNLMKWEKRDKWLWAPQLLNINKYADMWTFVESLRTIRNSKVIDIIKSGKVKLYPMSDADIWLLAWSVWLQLNSFANPTKAKETMSALNWLINVYDNNQQFVWNTNNQQQWSNNTFWPVTLSDIFR